MSKLLITTQTSSTTSSGFTTWGSNTYIVRDLSARSIGYIEKNDTPYLDILINYVKAFGSEEVLNHVILNDDVDEAFTPYDSVISLFFNKDEQVWYATKIQQNLGESHYREGIESVTEQWVMGKAGLKNDYVILYHMDDGSILTYNELVGWYDDRSYQQVQSQENLYGKSVA